MNKKKYTNGGDAQQCEHDCGCECERNKIETKKVNIFTQLPLFINTCKFCENFSVFHHHCTN